jgi:hypothetical protein
MDIMKLATSLCSNLTGSKCSVPKRSAWRLTQPGQANASVDVADLLTAGLTTILPANAKVYGSYFVCGLERSVGVGLKATVTGFGAGVGLGAGWSAPFIGASFTGNMTGIKKTILEKLGGSAQGFAIDQAKNPGTWGGGSSLVTGPDAAGDLVLNDFHNAYATVVGLSANAGVNGVSGGILIFAKQRPVLTPADLPYAKAFALMAGVGLGMSLDVEANSIYYNLRVTSGLCI